MKGVSSQKRLDNRQRNVLNNAAKEKCSMDNLGNNEVSTDSVVLNLEGGNPRRKTGRKPTVNRAVVISLAGRPTKEIAKEAGCSVATALKILHEAGCNVPGRGRPKVVK